MNGSRILQLLPKQRAKKEAEGLIDKGTLDYKDVVSRSDLVATAKASGDKVHIGQLMTLMSWKHAKNLQLKKL